VPGDVEAEAAGLSRGGGSRDLSRRRRPSQSKWRRPGSVEAEAGRRWRGGGGRNPRPWRRARSGETGVLGGRPGEEPML
jgi:hypothetical protein